MSQAAVQRAIDLLDVEHTECFLPLDGKTHCNSYAKVFCALAWGLGLPAKLANDLHTWLSEEENGWRKIDTAAALELTQLGAPLLACRRNPTGHGHIAPVVDAQGGRLIVSAAGAKNYARAPLGMSFGLGAAPDLFTHD